MLRSRLCAAGVEFVIYSASMSARSADVVVSSSTRQLRLTQPAGRVQSRGEREGNVFASQAGLRSSSVTLHQRRQPEPGPLAKARQAVLHQHAIFVHQRHDVGHGAQRRQADAPTTGTSASRSLDFLAAAGLLGTEPRPA